MKTPEEFWGSMDRSGGPKSCWIWLRARCGKTHRTSYGYLLYQGRLWRSNRLALTLTVGPAPDDKPWALHRCNTPSCCNPVHLYWGTPLENMQQMWAEGRGNPPHPKGYVIKAKLTEDQVRLIHSQPRRPVAELAVEFGVQKALIHKIRSGRAWSHITGLPWKK